MEEEKRFGNGSIFVRKEFFASSRELDPQILDDSRSLLKSLKILFRLEMSGLGSNIPCSLPKKKDTNDARLMM